MLQHTGRSGLWRRWPPHLSLGRGLTVILPFNSLVLLLVLGCSLGSPPLANGPVVGSGKLTVFAAASLANAFPEIAEAFQQQHPGVKVNFNFAGSQLLRTQLEYGAKADVFASADQRQMDLAGDAKLLSDRPVTFATNRLVVIVPKNQSGQATNRRGAVLDLEDLAKDGVKLALALPEAPAGNYARTVIQNLGQDMDATVPGFSSQAMNNVVSLEPNVRGVVGKVALDEVDAGIVYWSDAQTDYAASRVGVITIPEKSNVVASYPAAVLRGSPEPALARLFVQFMLSDGGRSILQKHRLGLPSPPTGLYPGAARSQ